MPYDQELDFMPLLGTDYVEFYVSNAANGYFYRSAFGFKAHAYAGLEQAKDRQSYVVIRDKFGWYLYLYVAQT